VLRRVPSSRCREEQQTWLLQTVLAVWFGFESEFQKLWQSPARCGDAHPLALYPRAERLESPDSTYYETSAVVRCDGVVNVTPALLLALYHWCPW